LHRGSQRSWLVLCSGSSALSRLIIRKPIFLCPSAVRTERHYCPRRPLPLCRIVQPRHGPPWRNWLNSGRKKDALITFGSSLISAEKLGLCQTCFFNRSTQRVTIPSYTTSSLKPE